MTNPEDWLNAHAIGYHQLDQDEREAIFHFALLWSLFESTQMDARASPTSIIRKVRQWDMQARLDVSLFEKPLRYFKERYFSEGAFTERFDSLLFRPSDRRLLVEAVLRGERQSASDIVAALLLIVYRLRNNLFHGEKWAYGIKGQKENFENANQFLMGILEILPVDGFLPGELVY